jgi:UTP--glucose-1-phosphate uridylyltransferase
MKVRKAVFPAAGLGTRFLPATKAVPKEMVPLLDRPILQWGVEEVVASGVEDVIVITGHGKGAMEDHFRSAPALEEFLERKGKAAELEAVRGPSGMARFAWVLQEEALGLGHAVGMAREQVGGEPFGVVLPDDVIVSDTPCLRQLIEVVERHGGGAVAVMEVPDTEVSRYGIVDAEQVEHGVYRVRGMVEKPDPADAPSNLAIIGRYVFPPEIFDEIDRTEPGAGGEIQLTDGMASLLAKQPIHAVAFEGTRYDAGTKHGFLHATLALALQHPELGPRLREMLGGLLDHRG